MNKSTQIARIDYLYALADETVNLPSQNMQSSLLEEDLKYEVALDKLHQLLQDSAISLKRVDKSSVHVYTTCDVISRSERKERIASCHRHIEQLQWRHGALNCQLRDDVMILRDVEEGVIEEWFGPLLNKNSPEESKPNYAPRAYERAYEHVE